MVGSVYVIKYVVQSHWEASRERCWYTHLEVWRKVILTMADKAF